MSRQALQTAKCGNETCVCAGVCGCPFGACTCFPEPVEEVVDEQIFDLQTLGKEETVINVNVGVLGHVNCGKTALVRALSKTLSTAALDKNPQSKERGMTLDLGFSSFAMQAPAHFNVDKVQYTLVDCPGHASLVRTIIGGAQIIDRMLLVVDVTKGIQAQTAECLVIGEILTDDMIIVLNKVDLLPEADREDQIKKMEATLRKALTGTKFANVPMVPVAAYVESGDENPQPPKLIGNAASDETAQAAISALSTLKTKNLIELVRIIRDTTQIPNRKQRNASLYFSVDHCFPIKGQGTILTGTVMAGKASVGDDVEIPDLGEVRKIKSIQRFHRAVQFVEQGDRASFAVNNLDSKKIERGVVCTPGTVPSSRRIVALIRKVKYFEKTCISGSKVHVTVGPSTGVATVTFFGSKELRSTAKEAFGKPVPADPREILSKPLIANGKQGPQDWEFDSDLKSGGKQAGGPVLQWVMLEFDHPVVCPRNIQLIGSRLDLTDTVLAGTCRIAFFGTLAAVIPENDPIESYLRVFKRKERLGVVDRVDVPKGADKSVRVDQLVGRGLFGKGTDMSSFLGLSVVIQIKNNASSTTSETGSPKSDFLDEAMGYIDSSFGKTGKFNVSFRGNATTGARAGDRIALRFKKFVIGGGANCKKEMVQD